jgi:uncharacterized alpha-E superfamily protein
MLSRVANSLYWMSRYIERAENIARIVDVNMQLLLDFREAGNGTTDDHWLPIIQATGDDERFSKLYTEVNGFTVREYLTFQTKNSNSLISCIGAARENARVVRDQITIEVWEEINRLYLFLHSPAARELWNSNPSEFYQEIKSSSLHLQGLADATIPHTEGWLFMQAAKYLERADKTTRILDIRHTSLPEKGVPTETLNPHEALEWAAVLRSCSGWDAYRQIHGADLGPRRVAEFLLLSEDFPRSVEFCIVALDSALRRISGVQQGRYSNEAEKLSGRLVAEVQFSGIEDIFNLGLHDYLDLLQQRFNQIGAALFAAYIFQPFNETEDLQQQQQQQQQYRISK